MTVTKFCDDRGSFQELYNSNEAPASIRVDQFRQISVSSSKRDVLRGMHTSPYSKLVGVISGAVYDVIVDLREDSPTFGKWIAHVLSRENCRQVHIPAGCAHGYLALEDTTMFYLQAGVFTPSLEQDVSPFDGDLNIYWPMTAGSTAYIMSLKDSTAPTLRSRRPHVHKPLSLTRNLIIGASGQVGAALIEEIGHANCFGTFSSTEISDSIRLSLQDSLDGDILVTLLTATKPSTIYLCGAKTWVDGCETDATYTFVVNAEAPAFIAKVASTLGIKICFFSTDYVFDGTAGPYTENDVCNPVNVYGKSKCAAEEKIKDENPHALIIRTTIVYGPEDLGKNFVYQLSERLSKNERMSCVSDQFSTPTYNRDLAKMASSLVDARCSGIYNCVGQELMSRYEFALKIARALGFDENLIDAVTTAELQIKLMGSGQVIATRGMKLGLRVKKTLDAIPNLKLNSVEDSLEDWLRHPRGKDLKNIGY